MLILLISDHARSAFTIAAMLVFGGVSVTEAVQHLEQLRSCCSLQHTHTTAAGKRKPASIWYLDRYEWSAQWHSNPPVGPTDTAPRRPPLGLPNR